MSPRKSICPLCQVLVLMQLVALSTRGCRSMLIASSWRISIRVSSNWTNTQVHHSSIIVVSMREFGFPYLTQEYTLIRSPIFGVLWDGYCCIFRGGYDCNEEEMARRTESGRQRPQYCFGSNAQVAFEKFARLVELTVILVPVFKTS